MSRDRGDAAAPTAPVDQRDEDVVARVRAGDVAAFELVMRRYNQRLYRVARAILRDDAEAEDVMQYAYVQAFTHLHQFEGRARFSSWLTKIAVHEALRRARRRRREPPRTRRGEGPEEDAVTRLREPGPNPEEWLHTQKLREILEAAIDGLPRTYRSVFVLRAVEGLSTVEAAASLGVSGDAVKTRLLRARALLREELLRRVGSAAASAFAFERPRCDRMVSRVLAAIRSTPAPASPTIH